MEEVSIAAIVLKPDEKGTAKFWFDPPYDEIVRAWARENQIRPGQKVRIIFRVWEDDCSVRAFNLFHALRDELAKAQGDTTAAYKKHLKECLKYDFGVTKEIMPGVVWLKSTTRYTWKEMAQLIDGIITRLIEEGAAIPDFLEEFKQLKKEQEVKNEIP